MLIEYNKFDKIKTIKFDQFLEYEYRLLKKIINEILLCNDNYYHTINFDIYEINDYSYYYIMKLINLFYKICNDFIKKSENINIYSSNNNKTLYDYIFSIISLDELSKNLYIKYIDNEINWKKTKSFDNIIFKNHLNNNLENNFIII